MHLLLDSKLQIGIVTHQKIRHLVSEGDVDPLVGRKFYCAVRCFFERAVEYSLENYSYDDELLKNASFINFEKRLESDLLQAEYFVKRLVNINNLYFDFSALLLYVDIRNFYHTPLQLRLQNLVKNL